MNRKTTRSFLNLPTGGAAFAIARCETGEVLTGGGSTISASGLVTTVNRPTEGSEGTGGWIVSATNPGALLPSVTISTYAVCLRPPA